MLFVEPSTGRCYPSEESPYYGIESLWNSTNYWVNMQKRTVPAGKLSFELSDSSKWEGLLYDSTAAAVMGDDGDEEGDDDGMGAQVDEVIDETKVLAEMPPSWVTRLHVPRDLFEAGCPQGRKQIVYRKGLVQRFAPYSREDGLVERHAYSLIAAKEVGDFKLVSLRNPWGNSREWNGPWSDASEEWANNPEVAEELGHTAGADGKFWMSFDDFLNVWTKVYLCAAEMPTRRGDLAASK